MGTVPRSLASNSASSSRYGCRFRSIAPRGSFELIERVPFTRVIVRLRMIGRVRVSSRIVSKRALAAFSTSLRGYA